MPSKRAKNKKLINWWIREENADALREYAKSKDVPIVDLIEEAIREKCKEWGVDYRDFAHNKFSNRDEKK